MDRRLEPADHDRNLAVAEPGAGGVANAVRRSRFTVVDGLFLLLIGFAVFNIPVVWIGEDSIGFFDLYLIFFLVTYLTLERLFIPPAWRIWFWAGAALLAYLLIDALLTQQPRGMLIVLKLAESVLAGLLAVAYFARKSIRVSIGITVFTVVAIALTAFQLASRFGLTSIVGMAPGFGIGSWRRVGLPFMQGTSSNPAGFVLGLLIVLFMDLSPHRRPVIKLALYILLITALLLTVSRTNIIALVAVIAFRFAVKAVSGERFFLVFLITAVLGRPCSRFSSRRSRRTVFCGGSSRWSSIRRVSSRSTASGSGTRCSGRLR